MGQVNTSATGNVTIQKKKGSGSWANWKTVKLSRRLYHARSSTGSGHVLLPRQVRRDRHAGGRHQRQVKVVVKSKTLCGFGRETE